MEMLIEKNGVRVEWSKESLVARGYVGKSQKSKFAFKFPNVEKLQKYAVIWVTEQLLNLEAYAKYKAEIKTAKAKSAAEFKAKLKPGVILCDSWGYEQTNVDFYVVTEMKGSKVSIQEIGCQEIDQTGWASGHVMPNLEDKRGGPIQKIVKGNGIRINSSVCLSLWDGEKMYRSSYY